jgi:hypothetical protein
MPPDHGLGEPVIGLIPATRDPDTLALSVLAEIVGERGKLQD